MEQFRSQLMHQDFSTRPREIIVKSKEKLLPSFGLVEVPCISLRKKYVVHTDHKPLLKLYNPTENPSSRILRWSLRLLPYDFDLKHNSGEYYYRDSS